MCIRDRTNALLEAINNGTISDAVIDVWEHEPEINRELLEKVLIGTPHIAGYSADGKANATRMSLDSICRFFHLGATYEITPPAPSSSLIEAKDREEALLKMYNPIEDSNRLKSHPELFETLRGDYPLRREEKAYMQVISNRSVSYTHLDVYKRQQLSFRAEKSATELISTSDEAGKYGEEMSSTRQ